MHSHLAWQVRLILNIIHQKILLFIKMKRTVSYQVISIAAKAFKGIHKKATIKVPKKQKKAYQKLLKSKGVEKRVLE